MTPPATLFRVRSAYGLAFVGNVGAGEVEDFTALGNVVNTAARLQGQAKAGQVVMSERV